MARRKIREQKSKFQGTKNVLKAVNSAAHEEEHRNPTPTSPKVATYSAAYKWGSST